MKNKLPKSVRELGRKIGDFDGKRKGMTQAEGEKAFQHLVSIRAAEIFLNRRKSVLGMINQKAERKAFAYMRKVKKANASKGKK